MKKFRVEFVQFQVTKISEIEDEVPTESNMPGVPLGDSIWAILYADDEKEARIKAEQLAHSLVPRNRSSGNDLA